MSVLAMLATAGAVVGLLLGARLHSGAVARGYRWLAGAAAFWLAGLIVSQMLTGPLSSQATSLSLADVAPLLGLATAATGIMVLAEEKKRNDTGSVLPGLADGYVMAVALLVIAWVVAFGSEFHHSNERPATFLLDLLHPLADLAVLGALLPVLTAAWRRVVVPYIGLMALAFADSLAVGARFSNGHQGILEQLAVIAVAILFGVAPWVETIAARLDLTPWRPVPGQSRSVDGGFASLLGGRRSPVTSAGAATIIASMCVVIAAFVVIINGLASAPASGLALVIAGGAAVLVVAIRILMLVRENGVAMRMWREASNSLRDLADRTGDMVLICDLDGTIGYVSPLVTGFSYQADELIGRPLSDFVHAEDVAAARAAIAQVVGLADDVAPGTAAAQQDAEAAEQPAGGGRFSCRVRAADGTWRHVECAALLYRLPGEPARLLLSVRDVSDQVALRQQVAHLTFHDGLTGLPNRAYVEERAREALEQSGERVAGVIFLDLDGFTAVNDLVGHGAGDLVLAQAARRLRAVVPAQDTVARWGGDEFAVLMENAATAKDIGELAERLAGIIAGEPFRVAERDLGMTASVGVALADGSTPGVVLRNADVAMARAKDTGGGRVEVYEAHMHADVVRRLDMASDLQRAIAREELQLQYQPIVELATSRVTGAEALIRWRRGDEAVSPRAFLAVAEDSGLIVALGEWVLRKVCQQGAAWRDASWDVGVSVNIALRQLNAPHFPAQVAAALAESGLPPSALTIELSERMLVEDAGLIADRLAELHDLGVKLAIDDFGTGYASLAHLRQLPADIIKIDPSFISGLGQDPVLAMLTKTIVQVGRDLGMQVVAEGIEQPRQLAELREMGCGYGQGFLVARPMAAPGVEALIRTGVGEQVSRTGSAPDVNGTAKPGVPAA
ncbi:EAL domain-containing protein [Trebonia kvetii]|uniref:EAL domain-containing protein n=1 Tax=Trebonia kvetii TaxID=2480626 RepID=A0A6P2BYK4_9ACTN|nr:bifunctional diguanylate cyclase/phosphodiesterase [Trebonia kvetii]TVZ04154.1 EAL domain-containing protein [Trebonia kvetii]